MRIPHITQFFLQLCRVDAAAKGRMKCSVLRLCGMRRRDVWSAAAPWKQPYVRTCLFSLGAIAVGLPFAGGVHVAGFGEGEVEDAVDAVGKFVVGGVYLAAEGGINPFFYAAASCVGHGTCRESNAPAVGEFAAERHPGTAAGVGADNHDVGERFHD